MKRLPLFFIVLVATFTVNAADWNKFGLLGECKSASSRYEELYFDDSGNLTSFVFYNASIKVESKTVQAIKGGFKGSCNIKVDFNNYSGNYQITIGANGMSKIEVKYDNGSSLTSSYSYGSDGLLVKRTDVEVWYEEDSYSLQTDAAARERKAQAVIDAAYKASARNPLDIAGNARRLEAAQRKAAAILAGTDVSIKTKKTKQTRTTVSTFDSYKKDNFSNWLSRKCKIENNNYDDNRKINYSDDYISSRQWEKLKLSNDLRAIEKFALSNKITKKYKSIAAEYWNNNILAEVARVDGNNPDSLCNVAFSDIASKEVRGKALDMARKDIYENQVLKSRDFAALDSLAKKQVKGNDVFDYDYVKLIEKRSNELRTDSINYLLNKAENELVSNQYQDASLTSKNLIAIDEFNYRAKEISAEADFRIIEVKEKTGTIIYDDYVHYLDINRGSKYDMIVSEKLIDYAVGQRKDYKHDGKLKDYSDHLSSINTLNIPMSERSKKKLDKAIEKVNLDQARHDSFSRFITFGPELSLGGSTGNEFVFDCGISSRIGYHDNPINMQVSFLYEYSIGTKRNNEYLTSNRLVLPVMLRWNFIRDKDDSVYDLYLACGAQISFPLKGSIHYLMNEDKYDDKLSKNYLCKTSISPRFAIGVSFFFMELEFFTVLRNNSFFNRENLQAIGFDSCMDPEIFDLQTKKGTKFQFGFTGRLLF